MNARKILLIFLGLSLLLVSNVIAMGEKNKMPEQLYATLKTNKGTIVCELFPQSAPQTVANFVGLANGEKEWLDPRSGEKNHTPLYNKTIFHRVIPNFMIQGGDPIGLGIGGPGYQFEDEINDARVFDQPGILAMANSGPNTNGSQFFITVAPTPWLNGHHTIFGRVIKGQDIVVAISAVERNNNDKPLEPVVLEEIFISPTI